jgi:hypothetical protein
MIDPRIAFVDVLLGREQQKTEHIVAERDKWRAIAERLYNATQETDYTILMRAVKAYEEACDD